MNFSSAAATFFGLLLVIEPLPAQSGQPAIDTEKGIPGVEEVLTALTGHIAALSRVSLKYTFSERFSDKVAKYNRSQAGMNGATIYGQLVHGTADWQTDGTVVLARKMVTPLSSSSLIPRKSEYSFNGKTTLAYHELDQSAQLYLGKVIDVASPLQMTGLDLIGPNQEKLISDELSKYQPTVKIGRDDVLLDWTDSNGYRFNMALSKDDKLLPRSLEVHNPKGGIVRRLTITWEKDPLGRAALRKSENLFFMIPGDEDSWYSEERSIELTPNSPNITLRKLDDLPDGTGFSDQISGNSGKIARKK